MLLSAAAYFRAYSEQPTPQQGTGQRRAAAAKEIRIVVSSQDSEGFSASDFNMNFLGNLENHAVENIKAKAKKARAEAGYTGPDLTIASEANYVEAGKTKLAVIRLSGSDGSFSVILLGITGNEAKRVACTWALPDPIPITRGACGEKVKEVFGSMIGE